MPSLRPSIVVLSIVALMWASAAVAREVPRFTPDPFWPKHLPNQWIDSCGNVYLGEVDTGPHAYRWIPTR